MELMVEQNFVQTEVGVIPQDWHVMEFGGLTERIVGGGTPSRAEPLFWNGNIPWVTVKDFTTFDPYTTQEYITSAGVHNSATNVIPKGTLIFCTRIALGKAVIYEVDACINQDLKAAFFKKNVDVNYLYYWFQQNAKRIQELGSGSTVMGISLPDLKRLLVSLPPTKEEQTAIATALSDADALIAGLEKLIEKKRLIKQGAMHELLRPKEGWEVKRLGEVLKIKHGKGQREVEDINGDYPILGTGGLMAMAHSYLYNKPTVLIGRKGTIDKPQYMDTPFWCVDTLFYSEVKEGYNAKFVYYLFQLIEWYGYNEASGVPSLSAKTIESIERSFPKTEKEQAEIAGVLTDMDNEIQALERKLAKQKEIKQGMMQVLLTGRVRLV